MIRSSAGRVGEARIDLRTGRWAVSPGTSRARTSSGEAVEDVAGDPLDLDVAPGQAHDPSQVAAVNTSPRPRGQWTITPHPRSERSRVSGVTSPCNASAFQASVSVPM